MSSASVQTGGSQSGRNWYLWLARLVGVAVVVFTVVATVACWGIRTPVVLGELLGPKIAVEAEARGLDLQIGAFGATGLTGIRLYEVDARARRDGNQLHVHADRIDVIPAVGRSLTQGRPVLRTVNVGRLDVRASRSEMRQEATSQEETVESGGVTDSTSASTGFERWFDGQLHLHIDEISVGTERFAGVTTFDNVAVLVDEQAGSIRPRHKTGQIAGVPVEVGADDEAMFVEFSSAALDELLDGIPLELSFDTVSLSQASIWKALQTGELSELTPKLREFVVKSDRLPLEVRVPESNFAGGDSAVRWETSEAMVETPVHSQRLERLELAYRTDPSQLEVRTEVSDEHTGRFQLEANWSPSTSMIEVDARFDGFQWDRWHTDAEGREVPVETVRIDGAVEGDIDLRHRLVMTRADIQLWDLIIDAPVVTREPIWFDRVDARLPVTLDLRGGAFSITGGEVGFEGLAPVELDGRIVDAGEGAYVFDVQATGDGLDVADFIERLPPALTGVADEAKLDGRFGVDIGLEGHSAYPESLGLQVDLDGDVEVVEDIHWGGGTDAGDDVVLFDPDASDSLSVQGRWTGLEELPDHIPAAVLAAEDTAFFEHGGVDWDGLQMALEENLEQGKLVRGGSTITQQVAKNLFLNHDRTIARKAQEAFLTWRLEESLSKEEILELYLNVVEWGPEIHGLYAAAHYFFDVEPEQLEVIEMVMLASILPNPIQFGGAVQAGYLPSSREDKMRRVFTNLRFLDDIDWDTYNAAKAQLDEGRMGRRQFEPCADDETAPRGARSCEEVEIETRDGDEMTFETWEVAETAELDGWAPLRH